VLKYLAAAINTGDKDDELIKVIKICLKRVYEFQVLDTTNSFLLKKEV